MRGAWELGMGTRAYIAVDLGAESGRVIVGTLAGEGGTSRLVCTGMWRASGERFGAG
jgi:hypothetical protein